MRTARRWVLAAVASSGVGVPGSAVAGRTPFGWLFGTEVLPERGAEIQSWLDEENGREPDDLHRTTWGAGALIGVTDQLALGFPIEMVWRDSDAIEPSFTLHQYGVEARYRIVSADPVEAPRLAPLARLAVKRDVTVRDAVLAEANLVLAATTTGGGVMGSLDLGFVGLFTPDETHVELRPGAGISIEVAGELRLGAEAYAEISLDARQETWAAVGPNLAWSHGRFWVSAAFGIGVYQIETAPKVQWGILF